RLSSAPLGSCFPVTFEKKGMAGSVALLTAMRQFADRCRSAPSCHPQICLLFPVYAIPRSSPAGRLSASQCPDRCATIRSFLLDFL
ncbi:MAG: hypothetical protein LBF79_02030, partial [Dysgonamonadaceae bacterium]|nr:hypothetical protein [Dysgonamonadaceae bacterium]